MELYIQRMIDEKQELDTKLEKLVAFRTGEKASILDENQKSLMDRQAEVMNTYSKVLAERINYEMKKTKEAL